VWTVAGGSDYTGKPRPVVIVTDDFFSDLASATVMTLTSDLVDSPLTRLSIVPNGQNGVFKPSQIVVEKITTVPKSKLGKNIGQLSNEDMIQLNRALVVYLGLAG
jgi:mRNA interferase MazF